MLKASISINQNGQVLLISLIFLIVLSLIGVSSIKTANSEQFMAHQFEDKEFALEAAEDALVEAEQWISNVTINPFIHAKESCSGDSRCFDQDCTNGLCLTGYLDSGDKCVLQNKDPWADKVELSNNYLKDGKGDLVNVWGDENRYKLVDGLYPNAVGKAKYIIEFYCFTQKDPNGVPPSPFPDDRHAWSQLYRITVLASGKSTETRVMLQSTFKKD